MFLVDHDLSPASNAERAPGGRNGGSRSPGTHVVVRGLELTDRDFVAAILERLGWQSRVQRFLAPRPILSERDLSMIMSVDGFDRAGTIAFAASSPIGAAHYVRTGDPAVAEIAVEVVDEWQRCGVGRLLLSELRVRALRAGCRRLEWFAFESNRAVAALAHDLCDCRKTRVGGGIVKWSATMC
jgi:GNAT superfamily N-acetyltransferase